MLVLENLNDPIVEALIKAAGEGGFKAGLEIGKTMIKNDRVGGYDLAIEVTGYKKQALYNMVAQRKIPFIKTKGLSIKFSEAALIEWMKGEKK